MRLQVQAGLLPANPTLSADAAEVDAVVSTIGFPLVGGPAGSMEGARQAELAKEILTAKNVPYFVAAPLLIQVWFLERCVCVLRMCVLGVGLCVICVTRLSEA